MAAVDSTADPGIADSMIGDGPDDVITMQVFECVNRAGLLFYADQAQNPALAGCWDVPPRVPLLVRP